MSSGILQIQRRRARDTPLLDADRRDRWAHLRPVYALVYVENACHMKCDHCYESDASHPPSEALSVDQYAALFDQLKALGVFVVTFSGGEVFLRRDLFAILDEAKKRRFVLRLYTTGWHIDERKADRIAALGISTVEMSLYSHDARVHDDFTHIPGSHARTLRAARLLRERGVPVTLKSNVMTFNVEALEPLADLIEAHDCAFQFDALVHPKTDGNPQPLQFRPTPEQLATHYWGNPRVSTTLDDHPLEGYCTGKNHRAGTTATCAAAKRMLTVGADGGIYACGLMPVAGGNLKDHSLDDIWFQSRQFDQIRSTTFDDMTHCGSCSVQGGCDPCFANALVETGDHRGCASGSKAAATGLVLAAHRRRAIAERAAGAYLPLVGADAPAGVGEPARPRRKTAAVMF